MAIAQAGNRGVAAKLLTDFINDFPKDPRICEGIDRCVGEHVCQDQEGS